MHTGTMMLCGSLLLGAAIPAAAQTTGGDFQATIWAASCMACHGTDGKAEGTGLNLAGKPEQELFGYLVAVREGRRSATIMHQHAMGYSEGELRRIARYFSQVKP
jgi:cytochrome subunit of sulfide dehydrogenase